MQSSAPATARRKSLPLQPGGLSGHGLEPADAGVSGPQPGCVVAVRAADAADPLDRAGCLWGLPCLRACVCGPPAVVVWGVVVGWVSIPFL